MMLGASPTHNSNSNKDIDGRNRNESNTNDACNSPMIVDEEMISSPSLSQSSASSSSSAPFHIDERVYFISTTDRKKGNNDNSSSSKSNNISSSSTNSSSGNNNNSDNSNNNKNGNYGIVEYFEAIIRQAQYTEFGWKFFIHFVGWNTRWDRWVDSNSLVKDTNDVRRNVQQQLVSFPNNNGSGTTTPITGSNISNKRRTLSSNDGKESSISSQQPQQSSKRSKGTSKNIDGTTLDGYIYSDYCELPLTLKTVLIDEYERLTRQGYCSPHGYDDVYISDSISSETTTTTTSTIKTSLFTKPPRMVHGLPAQVTIRKVIEHFEKKKIKEIEKNHEKDSMIVSRNNNDPEESITMTDRNKEQQQANQLSSKEEQKNSNKATSIEHVQTFCSGLIELLEQAIPTCLLYPQERPQYEYIARKIQKQKASDRQQLVDIYGCEYLLRLIVRLPTLLQPIAEAALAISSMPLSSPTSTPTNTIISSSLSFSTANFGLHDPFIIGPFITELLVLMQKNRNSLFKISGHYRSPMQGKEWLDYEENMYRNG